MITTFFKIQTLPKRRQQKIIEVQELFKSTNNAEMLNSIVRKNDLHYNHY